MRDLIHLIENNNGATIHDVIVQTGKEYIEKGLAPSLYEINNGGCEDFADDVIRKLGGENDRLFTIWADGYSVDGEGDVWDVPLLKQHWPKCHPTHGLTWPMVMTEVPRHAWIVSNNRHYDCECPEGVDNFFELPLFRRGMERIAARRKKKPLGEMATKPPESLAEKTFYHGTGSQEAAKGILKNGLQPPDLKGRNGHLTPVNGMVYLTPDLGYALIYAAGGSYIGNDSYKVPYRGTNKLKFTHVLRGRDGTEQRYGYIFEFSGADLTMVQPDEDAVGDLYHYILCKSEPNPAYCEPMFIKAWEALKADPRFMSWFTSFMGAWVTDNQKTKIEQGEYAYYAAAGKRAIKQMSDDMKSRLCELGLHVAHQGALRPSACYKFDKTKIGYMDKHGANFFDFAKKIR